MKLSIRTALGTAILAALAASAWGQTPPVGARDITTMPPAAMPTNAPATTPSAPSAQIEAPAAVVRVYIDAINGSDAAALTGLISQSLFQSGQVVVTENQSNASVILKGTVTREAEGRSTAGARGTAKKTAVTPSDDGSDLTLTEMPSFGADTSDADLSRYRYRLNLRLVNPDGDLVWMSGQGREALPYAPADTAVGQTLAPMFKALAALEHAPAHE